MFSTSLPLSLTSIHSLQHSDFSLNTSPSPPFHARCQDGCEMLRNYEKPTPRTYRSSAYSFPRGSTSEWHGGHQAHAMRHKARDGTPHWLDVWLHENGMPDCLSLPVDGDTCMVRQLELCAVQVCNALACNEHGSTSQDASSSLVGGRWPYYAPPGPFKGALKVVCARTQ